MERRGFMRNTMGMSLLAILGPSFTARAKRAEPRRPMGRPLGSNQTLLVHNAKLVDVETGRLFGESALLIRGERIEKRLSKVAGADFQMDAEGKYVVPGLINNHCHMSHPGVADLGLSSLTIIMNASEQIDRNCVDCIMHGVTTVRDQLGRQSSIIKRKNLIASGELMGPRILRGICIDVPHGYLDTIALLRARDGIFTASNISECRDAVDRAVDHGADHIKVAMQCKWYLEGEKSIPMMSDEMFAAIVDKAAGFGKTVSVHHTSLDGFHKARRAEIQCFEHMASDNLLNDEDIEKFIQEDRAIVPTSSVAWALIFPVADDENFSHPLVQEMWQDKDSCINDIIDEYAVPPLAKVGKRIYRDYSSPGYFDKNHYKTTPSAEFFNAAGAIGGANLEKMYKAGCKIGCGNDGGIPFIWPGSMSVEMILLQKVGMKASDILRSATAINSKIIGMEHSLGTLDPGKFADMVFLESNPLERIENITQIAGVLQSGRLVYGNGNHLKITR